MNDRKLNLIDHLEEFRKRIIIAALAFLLFFVVGFLYAADIYKWFVQDLNVKLLVLGPSDIMWIYFMIAGLVAVAGAVPVLATQIWLFVRPALSLKERKITLTYIPSLFVLFIMGLAFGYFVILPMIFRFLIQLGGDLFVTNFTAERYFQFVLNMSIPFGVLFELPVVIMFLTSIGIMNPYVLSKIRKYAYFVLVIIAVVITPPDFMSDFIVTLPLLLLYEISINLSKFIYRKKIKAENTIEDCRLNIPLE